MLALRALGLGDLLTAVPALRGLRRAYPDHRLVLAAPAGLAELVALTGAVDEPLPTPRLAPLPAPASAPEVAVNLHGQGPRSTAILRDLGPGTLLTHAHPEHPGVPGPSWRADLHEVARWCRLLGSAGIGCDPADLGLERPAQPSPAPGAVVVHPGAGFPARHWPATRYATVARELARGGRAVVVTGDPGQRGLAERVAAGAGLQDDAVLAGRTSLGQLAALVADASLVVCGDTGVAHLATAYGTPSVVLFGPVAPRHWGPPPDRRQHLALWAGRTGDTFAGRPEPGLLQLTPDDVLAAAAALNGRAAAAGPGARGPG